ncbi:unnamed protein product [Penicillium glandicola]
MTPEPIAIIGTGCKFPGSASSPSRLWDLLHNPKTVASEPPSTRFDNRSFYDPDPSHHGTTNTKESYFLSEDISLFDSAFFNISASEAEGIDPQQRLLLETVYESLEIAGQRLEALQGSLTGVFCGVMGNDWEHRVGFDDKAIPRYAATGLARNNIANRVSYFFDWHGPSLVVDTACSSSLVALHQAVTALRQGECSVAVAAGTNLLLHPNIYISTSNLQMLSPNGRGRMWDAKADGYARGEGIGSLVLKCLSDAIADGDPIECVVRATGVNQDGRTMGLTMPSSKAQLALIESTYAQAGLDPKTRLEDRCQYFEAHGTGTLAGDPQEASAIYQAFFGEVPQHVSDNDSLYVGSIKTVVGHTEGTAGLAGVIKATLSIQHGIIFPNLLFDELNPELQPFTTRLKVPTETMPWPTLAPNVPRRVSVNSFGFGGTNAHAILESYDIKCDQNRDRIPSQASTHAVLPFIFSAASAHSLGTMLRNFEEYLQRNSKIHPMDLAWTLMKRRSMLTYRVVLCAPTIEVLITKIHEELELRKSNNPSTIIVQPTSGQKRVLGIFTGQGAQWPRMGLDLVTHSSEGRRLFDEMNESLESLPVELQPTFSLFDELAAAQPTSRLHEAILSQPLCAALQIILANFLTVIGISFEAVVGHSSGEIAAAYSAGIFSASDAIRVAYLRGRVVGLAGAPSGQPGAMLAVGLSPAIANILCLEPDLQGRIHVAASNSPSSVTLSGDRDAIHEVEQRLQVEGKFARMLQVDTAYHSHHMVPCAKPYLLDMDAAQIKLRLQMNTRWYSSVYDGEEINFSEHGQNLTGEYWKDNMISPVLFTRALLAALTADGGSPDVIIEIGPHPALKGPVQQTVADALPSAGGLEIPYIGVSSRGTSGIECLANAIGLLCVHLGPNAVDLARYFSFFDQKYIPDIVRGLPAYPFDHRQRHWFDTRKLKNHLYNGGILHPLLGSLEANTADGEWRWRHYLRREKLEWLDGHRIQSRTVFPATGYIAMAIEAAAIFAAGRSMRLVQVRQFSIHQAITFSEDNSTGIETLFRFSGLQSQGDQVTGTFNCHANIGGRLADCASGKLVISWGEPEINMLPSQIPPVGDAGAVDISGFYQSLARLGYDYTGPFQGITSLARRKDKSTGQIINMGELSQESSLLLHPVMLDTSLQMLLGAIGAPGDGSLYTLLVPTGIERVTINPSFCGPKGAKAAGRTLLSDAFITQLDADGCSGAVEVFTQQGSGMVQMEGVRISPLVKPDHQRQPFSEIAWGPLTPDAGVHSYPYPVDLMNHTLLMEQISLINIKQVMEEITKEDRSGLDWHRSRVVAWMEHVLELTRTGKHPTCQPEWLDGTQEHIDMLLERLAPSATGLLAGVVGANLLRFLRGETSILEEARKDDVLGRFYKEDPESKTMNDRLGDLVGQITFRYPRMKILEIGAGSGSATKSILERIGSSYHSYTFTDISPGFFEEAKQQFSDHNDHFVYQVLNVEQDPSEQGFEDNSYDLIIAANVLHATRSMKGTMTNVRRLLKPGGYLGLMEVTNTNTIGISFCVGGFEGWWAGEDDGRVWGPMLNASNWEHILQDTGFGGIETMTTLGDSRLSAYSVFISQAVDDRMKILRQPLSLVHQPEDAARDLVIIGGEKNQTVSLVDEVTHLLAPFFARIVCSQTLESLKMGENIFPNATILSLVDMDSPCFEYLSKSHLQGLQALTAAAMKMLWVTIGPETDSPYFGMSKGWLKCLSYEHPEAQYQYLNIADHSAEEPTLIAATLMRLVHTNQGNDHTLSSQTFATEPELRFQNGAINIPRLRTSLELNDRYAAGQQPVHKRVNLFKSTVSMLPSVKGHYALHLEDKLLVSSHKTHIDPQLIQIRIRYSTMQAVRVGKDNIFLHLVLGEQEDSRRRLLAFSKDHASIITTPMSWCCDLPAAVRLEDESSFLQATLAAVLARVLVQQATRGSVLWAHEANKVLQQAIRIHAVANGVRPHFTTSSQPLPMDNVSFIHPLITDRKLVGHLPKDVSVAACFGFEDQEDEGIFSRIKSLLPQWVTVEDTQSLWCTSQQLPEHGNIHHHHLGESLNIASTMATQLVMSDPAQPIDVEELSALPSTLTIDRIVEWAKCQYSTLNVQVKTASETLILSSQKTYLLVGMTGDLGQSLCHWLITKGARHVVLTSRSPKVDPHWIDEMFGLGANVVTMQMDVSNRESLLRVCDKIQKNHPRIGGVVNGALVLNDSAFDEISLETMQATLAAKVDGSKLLSELFRDDLDFFILMGSLTGIVGNWNQSAYSAATGFQSNLIHQRRAQNLVGSIIHPGIITSVGYISRKGEGLAQHVSNTVGSLLLSERDLHEVFAETILAGHPATSRNPEIVAGMPMANPVTQPDIIWYRNPLCWDFVDYRIQSSSASHLGDDKTFSMKARLESAASMSEAAEIVAAGLADKVRSKFNLASDVAVTPDTQLSDLGIDSLVAVDLRSWFVRELSVEIPMLQILSGSSLWSLTADCVSKLPPTLLPGILRRDESSKEVPGLVSVPEAPSDASRSSTSSGMDEVFMPESPGFNQVYRIDGEEMMSTKPHEKPVSIAQQ